MSDKYKTCSLLMSFGIAVLLLIPLRASASNNEFDWVVHRSDDGRFLQMSFAASMGCRYTIERSQDLVTWKAVSTYLGFGQTIRYAVYEYSADGSESDEPLVESPDTKFVNLQVSRVGGGGVFLVWPSIKDGADSKLVYQYLPSANLEEGWPALSVGVYGDYHITQALSEIVLNHVPDALDLVEEDTAFVYQFVASLQEMNAAVASSSINASSVVATGLVREKSVYFRIREHQDLDTDGDGLSNEAEIETFGSNWLAADSNYDGVNDRYQLYEPAIGRLQMAMESKADTVDGKVVTSQLPVKTYLLLGQSNAQGNAVITGRDNAPRPSVQVFNRATGHFQDWDNSNPVPGMGATENFAYRFAQQMEKVGVNSRFVVSVASGASITSFLPVTGSNMLKLEEDLKSAGVTQVDGVIWMQGETDGFGRMNAADYKEHFEAIRNHISDLVGNDQIPWVVGELAAGLHSQDSKNLVFDSYAADPLVRVMPNRDLPTSDGVHFTGDSLVRMGAMAFAAINGVARTSSDPVIYQQWAEMAVDYGSIRMTSTGSASFGTDSGYLRMDVREAGDMVKGDLVTTGFALKIGTGQSSRFDRYGARVSFRIPSVFPDNTTLVLNLGVHPAIDMSGDLTAAVRGVQLRITKSGIALATSDGFRLTENSLATSVSSGQDIDSFVLEIDKSKALLYRSKENSARTMILECDNVPQGDYGGFCYGANVYMRANAGANGGSLYVDHLKIATRRYGL